MARPGSADNSETLAAQVRALLPHVEIVTEYRFHPQRRWRADVAIPMVHILAEIEGGAWTRGRHTRGAGFVADMEKYNAATLAGWRVFRYTPKQVEDGTAAVQIAEAFWMRR